MYHIGRMHPFEERIYYPLAKLRTKAFKPFNRLFTAIGLSADMISYLGPLLMVAFIFVLPDHPVTAFWLLFARMMADVMDGPLARYQKTDSDRGKFVDVLMDNLSFGLFVIAVIRAGLLHGTTGSTYLFVTELLVVLMIIRYNFKHKSEWHFYASAGSLPYIFVYASYLLFAITAFGGKNYLNGADQVFTLIMIGKLLVDYREIQKTKKS